ncbi:MAG: biotin/lipoyl-binding protein [Alphaproteobacteria bacterium]|nr:biotin/lipoyl-binding protein [Alphaproteobacteria bacterium]MCB9985935.1 biotin/lipoyl-binding protein [Micavibrio sp.]HRK96910.1 biotin/lipoyl-binding protein [Alphaproteobacteria bacterium]
MNDEKTFKLPRLKHGLKYFPGSADPTTGEPSGVLHDPVSNNYFKLTWAECECISRFWLHKDSVSLISDVNTNTSLNLDEDDLKNLIVFLISNHLIESDRNADVKHNLDQGFWKKLLHQYLYFTVPLFHPQNFLKQTYHYVDPLLSKGATLLMVFSLIVLAFVTMERGDEFFKTASGIPSASGLMTIAIVFAFVKLIHEWAHAYTATKYGVQVPHMGAAFIVLYPVLYTETSGAWRLTNKLNRMAIGFAGIRAELCLATIFLLFWNISPSGSLIQTLSFYVVAVSLMSSLVVNLNPLMRFDGYYLLSDFMQIENLQSRSCSFARHAIRKILFGLNDPRPEDLSERRSRFLMVFGLVLLVYRFFLFSGIAILVYTMIFQPLGTILFLIEIWFFLIRPILSEIKIWKERSSEILVNTRARIIIGILIITTILFVLPVHSTISVPSVAYHKTYREVHAPVVAEISKIFVKDNDLVHEGDVLMVLTSPKLEQDYALAKQDLEKLQFLKRVGNLRSSGQSQKTPDVIEEQIDLIHKKIIHLEDQIKNLIIVSGFEGQVRDMMRGISIGRTVRIDDVLLRVIDPSQIIYVAYIPDTQRDRIQTGNTAKFVMKGNVFSHVDLFVKELDKVSSSEISSPELIAEIGGDIGGNQQKYLRPKQSLYRVKCEAINHDENHNQTSLFKQKGILLIKGENISPLGFVLRQFGGLLRRELSLN